jgi:hypothetical protein
MTQLTALGRLAEKSSLAYDAACRNRDAGNRFQVTRNEGRIEAYTEAHRIMQNELKRLRNLLQNGCLKQSDFGDDLPY